MKIKTVSEFLGIPKGTVGVITTQAGTRGYIPQLKISNTNLSLIKKLKKLLGGTFRTVKKYKIHYKTAYVLTINSNLIREILPKLSLIVRKKQSILLLKALRILRKRQWGYGKWHPNESLNSLKIIHRKLSEINGNRLKYDK